MMKMFKSVLEYLSIFLILCLISIVVLGIFGRLLDISLPWYDELASVVLVWLTYIGSAYVVLIRGHMSFEGLLSSLKGNIQKIIFAISECITITFFIIVSYYGYLVLEIFADESMISLPWVHLSFTQSIIPIAGVLCIIARILAIPETWRAIQQGKSAEDEYIEDVLADVQSDKKS